MWDTSYNYNLQGPSYSINFRVGCQQNIFHNWAFFSHIREEWTNFHLIVGQLTCSPLQQTFDGDL